MCKQKQCTPIIHYKGEIFLYNTYSLAPGVSFDLLQHLYKLEHPTVLCCSPYIRYMHCGPDICTAGLSVMITSGPQAINQFKHPHCIVLQSIYQIYALWARYMHCWAVCYDNIWTTGYKSIQTPHCSGFGSIHALRPRALRALGPRACKPARSLTGVF